VITQDIKSFSCFSSYSFSFYAAAHVDETFFCGYYFDAKIM